MDKIFNYIRKGKEQGARLLTGGQTSKSGKGYFVQPTVFADVKDDMTIAKEEIFGPVMSILYFASIDFDSHNTITPKLGVFELKQHCFMFQLVSIR